MAGLLTFPSLLRLPSHFGGQWQYRKQTLCLRGLQLQVQFRTLTGFPCIDTLASMPTAITIIFALQRYYFFSHKQPLCINIFFP